MVRAPEQHTVVAIAAGPVAIFELAVSCEVFGIDRSELVAPKRWYRFIVCGLEPGPLETQVPGLTIDVPRGLDAIDEADTVVVPATHEGWQPPTELLDALRRAHARGARILSVCTGAFLLAEAGLLDGRRATTHWMHAADLAKRYPKVDVDARVLYVDEGDVLTSAGTAAGVDLCLHVVRLDFGADVANAVARRMVVPPHRDGGQAQYVDLPVATVGGEDPLEGVMQWMLEHLDEPMTVDDLAEHALMSPRTFARRFRQVTGTTPLQWLLGQRLLHAQRLLETTDEAIETIAWRCGFGSAATLRHHFTREMSTSPLAYRRCFRGDCEGDREEAS
jgi:transcriptional regulator GlxA family with amidase domain